MSDPSYVHQAEAIRRNPGTDPLALILYRLDRIEGTLGQVVTPEAYRIQTEQLERRLADLETAQDESQRTIRQMLVGLIMAAGVAVVTAGMTIL